MLTMSQWNKESLLTDTNDTQMKLAEDTLDISK